MSTEKVKVGDMLAFRRNSDSPWQFRKVTKITPSGRIVCGTFYTLNPDLSVRGGDSFSGPSMGYVITPEIMKSNKEHKNKIFLQNFDFTKLKSDQVDKVVALLNSF